MKRLSCEEMASFKFMLTIFRRLLHIIYTKGGEQMGMNGMGGPDMAKMLQMMMPYMDPSTKRMMSIMMKLQELKSLMEPAQPQKEDAATQEGGASAAAPREAASPFRTMDDMGKAGQKVDLAATLQDGLTPEQQSMITSLSGMLR